MKRTFSFAICLLLVYSYLHAQDDLQFTTLPESGRSIDNFLGKGVSLIGFDGRISSSFGKTKYDGQDNARKPSDIYFKYGVNYQYMVNDHLAVGGQFQHSLDVNKDKEQDTRQMENSLYIGPTLGCYKACGRAQNGGMFSTLYLKTGFSKSSYTYNGEKNKDDAIPFVGASVSAGGYYAPTDRVLVTASLSMLHWKTEFMKASDSSSGDMVMTSVSASVKDMIPSLGMTYMFK